MLYESSVPATEQVKAPPEQMKAGFELWAKWMEKATPMPGAGQA